MSTLYSNLKKELYEATEIETLMEILDQIYYLKDNLEGIEYPALKTLFEFKRMEITGKW